MRLVWNTESVRWFRNASEYTGYNKKLAAILLEQIPNRGTLCDIGCGAGLIDFELAPYFQEITCVDISQEAINAVKEDIQRKKMKNITALCMDGNQLKGTWDTIIALFHGGADFFSNYFFLARERLILATYIKRKGNFGPEDHKAEKAFDVTTVKTHLNQQGIQYTFKECAIEHGQPLKDFQEAEAFVKAYTTPMSTSEMSAYLESHLQKTGREDFPYYLPNEKQFGLFVIERARNEKFLKNMERHDII